METKQSGGKLLPHSDLWEEGVVFLGESSRNIQRGMKIVTWNVRSLYRAGSLKATMSEIRCSGCTGGQVGQRGQSKRRGLCFFPGKEMIIINWDQVFVHSRIVSAVKIVEFVSDRLSYIVLRGRWRKSFVVNGHAPSEEKSKESKDSFYGELEQVFENFLKYHTKILLGDFNAKVGRENILKPTIGQDSPHQDINDNGVKLVNFATSRNLLFKSTMFHHRNIHKYTWTSPDGKTHHQIDHILTDRR